MTIRHLRIFLAVADSGTMSQAAKKIVYHAAVGQPGGQGVGRTLSGSSV